MNEGDYGKRLGRVEENVATLHADMAVVKNDVGTMRSEMRSVGAGVQQILQQNAARGEGFTIKAAGQYAFSLVALAGFIYGIIAMSPAIQSLRDQLSEFQHEMRNRVGKLDDREVGRVPRIEQRLTHAEAKIEAWRTTVSYVKP